MAYTAQRTIEIGPERDPEGVAKEHLYDDLERAIHLQHDGLPSLSEIANSISLVFIRHMALHGADGTEDGLQDMASEMNRLASELEILIQLWKLGRERDLPTVEEFERTDWRVERIEPKYASRVHYARMDDRPSGAYLGYDANLAEHRVETRTVEAMVKAKIVGPAPPRTYWIAISQEAESIFFGGGMV